MPRLQEGSRSSGLGCAGRANRFLPHRQFFDQVFAHFVAGSRTVFDLDHSLRRHHHLRLNNVFRPVAFGGGNITGQLYFEGGCSENSANFYFFNNIVKLNRTNCCGGIGTSTGHSLAYNNTLIGPSGSAANTSGLSCYGGVSMTRHCSIFNNVVTTEYEEIGDLDAVEDPGSPDYNVYANCTSDNCFDGYSTFSAYRVANPGLDSHSVYAAGADLDSNGVPQSGSPALNAGINLSNLCTGSLTPLCSDITGHPRPTTGRWDAGAYEVSH